MQLRRGGMFTVTCPQNVPVKKFWKSVYKWRRYGQSQSGTFFWDTVYKWVNCNV